MQRRSGAYKPDSRVLMWHNQLAQQKVAMALANPGVQVRHVLRVPFHFAHWRGKKSRRRFPVLSIVSHVRAPSEHKKKSSCTHSHSSQLCPHVHVACPVTVQVIQIDSEAPSEAPSLRPLGSAEHSQ